MKSQRKYLERAQRKLNLGPVELARALDTNWNTYKAWLYERNPLPGAAKVAIELLIEKEQTSRSWF